MTNANSLANQNVDDSMICDFPAFAKVNSFNYDAKTALDLSKKELINKLTTLDNLNNASIKPDLNSVKGDMSYASHKRLMLKVYNALKTASNSIFLDQFSEYGPFGDNLTYLRNDGFQKYNHEVVHVGDYIKVSSEFNSQLAYLKKIGLVTENNCFNFYFDYVFPVKDKDGNIIGFKAFSSKKQIYHNSNDCDFYIDADNLYGLYEAVGAVKANPIRDYVILVNSVFEVFNLKTHNIDNVAAIGSSCLSYAQIDNLEFKGKHIVLLPEATQFGFQSTYFNFMKLLPRVSGKFAARIAFLPFDHSSLMPVKEHLAVDIVEQSLLQAIDIIDIACFIFLDAAEQDEPLQVKLFYLRVLVDLCNKEIGLVFIKRFATFLNISFDALYEFCPKRDDTEGKRQFTYTSNDFKLLSSVIEKRWSKVLLLAYN